MRAFRNVLAFVSGLGLSLGAGIAMATPPATIGDLADAVDFSDVSPGILGVAGALITLYVIIKGVRIVLGFVRGG